MPLWSEKTGHVDPFTTENPPSAGRNDIRYPLVFPGEVYMSHPRNLTDSKLWMDLLRAR